MAARDVSVDDDDDFSFSSELTIEPDDEFKSNSNSNSRQGTRRVHWTPNETHHINLDSQNSKGSSGAYSPPSVDLEDPRGENSRDRTAARDEDNRHNPDTSLAIVGANSHGAGNNPRQEVRAVGERILRIIIELLPSLFLTCAIQFIKLLSGVHLFLVGLIVFQALFWPSLAYVLFSLFWKKTTILKPFSTFSQGKWVNLFLLQVHGTITMGAVLLQLLSIEYLNVTVSLAMSFLPCIILVLMEHIMEEKSCSLELILTLVFGYLGVVCASIPSLLTEHPQLQSRLYKGIAASIGSSLLCIEASLLLNYLRNRNTDDSLVTLSIGLQGTILCGVIGACMHVLGPLRQSNAGFVSAILLCTLLGILLLISKMTTGVRREIRRETAEGGMSGETSTTEADPSSSSSSSSSSASLHHVSILKQRVLIFAFSCVWGLFKQFHKHTFPSVFSVLGVTLIVGSFLLSVAFREWNVVVNRRGRGSNQEIDGAPGSKGQRHGKPFRFIPWLFSREPIVFIH